MIFRFKKIFIITNNNIIPIFFLLCSVCFFIKVSFLFVWKCTEIASLEKIK